MTHPPADDTRATVRERAQRALASFAPEAPDRSFDERAVLADDFLKPTFHIIGGVLAASLFAYLAASPTFDAPNVWSNSFRFDTAFVLVWGPLLFRAMYRFKLQRSLRVYLVLSLFIESFSETMLRDMNAGFWDTVLWPAAVAYYGTLKEWAGIPGGSIPVFTFVSLGLLYRGVWGKTAATYVRPPRFARNLLLVFLGTIVALSVLGLVHGGPVQSIFRQTFHLLQLPLIGLVFLYGLRIPEDLGAIGTIYVVTALARSALVIFIYFGIATPLGITDIPGRPEWCTTHSDSVLFVMAIVIVTTHAFEQRRSRVTARAAGITLMMLVAILLNNRRLAFVGLLIAPAKIYLGLAPGKRKRRITAALFVLVPAVVLYLLIASEVASTSLLFKPAKLIMSMLDKKDLSSLSRDVENENLIYTLRQNPLMPTGFGFEYQFSPDNPPVDLTDVFANYRLIAHNGVLWMWSWGGLLGFTALWSIFTAAGTLAMRAYRNAETALDRSAALSAFGAVSVCAVQVWGDQGMNGYMTLVTFGVAFAVATRLAVRQSVF